LLLTPAAHALLQAAIDIEHAAAPLTTKEVWSTPGGAPSVGFHLRHIAGSIDRLLTYARGRQLSCIGDITGISFALHPPKLIALKSS
jgi:hypothetical protein